MSKPIAPQLTGRASNFGQPVGPCIVLGPHVEHRDSNGVRWALLAEGAL